MSRLNVGNIILGEGLPKICIPLTGKDRTELSSEIRALEGKPFDLVEWRADYMMAAMKGSSFWEVTRAVLNVLGLIKSLIEKPVLFTVRTAGEGGRAAVTAEDYFFINRMVVDSGMADLIDVEAFICEGTDMVSEFIKYAHNNEQAVLLSNHDFEKTPSLEELISKYVDMTNAGGDIVKLAVMPHEEDDVARMLSAAAYMNEEHPGVPLIAISMGQLGMSSRICAGQFGSVMTFASGNDASAPGQIDAETLQGYLERYYK